MKKALLVVCLILFIQTVFACDICGCSSGNYFLGPFPQFRKHFFGTRYSFRSFESKLQSDEGQYSKDFYQTVELWGGVNISRKWQVLGFVPYNINKQTSDDGVRRMSGVGDVTVISNYKVFDNRTTNKKENMISQQIWVGGGLKLPTGKFTPNADDIIPDANNQAGTGSVDFVIDAMYTFHFNDWGINSNANYKINNSSKDFRFGNRFNAAAFIFHSISNSSGNTTFNPNLGLLYENLKPNKMANVKVEDTGGNALLGAAGVEVNFAKMAVGASAKLPIAENLSNHQTSNKVRGMCHVTFTF
jgi:hypothetical protein